jgi:CheY-like chemotaxis protein
MALLKERAGPAAMKQRMVVLVAEDDQLDLELLKRAMPKHNGVVIDLHVTRDGEELIHYLRGHGKYSNRINYPFPDLIVLDLKMPKLSGLQVLKWLHEGGDCSRIPTIMLSGSSLDRDVEEAYRLGVNTFFTKPAGLENLRDLMRRVVEYWSASQRPTVREPCASFAK